MLQPPAPGAGQTRIAGWRKRLCAHARACVCVCISVSCWPNVLVLFIHLSTLFAPVWELQNTIQNAPWQDVLLAQHKGGGSGGFCGWIFIVVPRGINTHSKSSHTPYVYTAEVLCRSHTCRAQERTLLSLWSVIYSSFHLIIPRGDLDPFPSLFISKALLFFTKGNSRIQPSSSPDCCLFICKNILLLLFINNK